MTKMILPARIPVQHSYRFNRHLMKKRNIKPDKGNGACQAITIQN